MTILSLDESINKDAVFEIEQVQLQFELNKSLHKLLVQNNVMYLILTQSVYMIDLSNPSIVKHIELGIQMEGGKAVYISSAWLHWNGHHLIVSANTHQCFYLHKTYQQFKPLPRFKGFKICSIAFLNASHLADDSESLLKNTGDFLVGTTDGSIYVSLLKSHDVKLHDSKRDDKYFKQVHTSTFNNSLNGSNSSNYDFSLTYSKNNVIVSSSNELLLWSIGTNSYNDIIKGFRLPPTHIRNITGNSRLISDGTSYLFVDNSGLIATNDEELTLSQRESLPWKSSSNIKESIIFTKHHILALDEHNSDNNTVENIKAFVKLSVKGDSLTFDAPQNDIRGVVADYLAGTYWLYTNNNIYEILISNESGSVWYHYYKMGKYEDALNCLNEQDDVDAHQSNEEANGFVSSSIKRDLVLIKQGYSYLQLGGFGIDYNEGEKIKEDLFDLQIEGIKTLAKLSEPFEKVCLMLMSVQSDESTIIGTSVISEHLLVEYLLIKFQLAKSARNSVRMVVLSSWIIELMLRMIYKAHDEKVETLLDSKFKAFLAENYKHFDPVTIYQVIMGFNLASKLIYYAELIKDYEFILNYYMELEDWTNLLKTLIKIYTTNDKNDIEILYRKATVLLVNAPRETVDLWIKLPLLDYERILPSLLTYNKGLRPQSISENELIRFLQKVIYEKEYKSEAIYNYYLSLLISYPTEKEQASKLVMKLLKKLRESSLRGGNSGSYDANFILRQCLSYKHFHPAIFVLMNDMKCYEEALKLALDNGLTWLAQLVLKRYDLSDIENFDDNDYGLEDIGESVDFDEDLRFVGKIKLEEETFSSRKKMWLLFSKYLIEKVCKGETLEFLNDIEINDETETDQNKGQDNSPSENAAQSLISKMTSNQSTPSSLPHIDLLPVRKLLAYLLSASYTTVTQSNVLSLKDILPLFPSSIMINNFKSEIIQSLTQYNNKIGKLSSDMQESLQISTKLKQQIKESQTLSERGKIVTIIEPGEPCGICKELLISKQFVCFPNCSHSFHKDCLVKFYLRLKSEYKFKMVFETFKKYPSTANKVAIDKILLKECVLCNESTINTIDDNIIDMDAEKETISAWVL